MCLDIIVPTSKVDGITTFGPTPEVLTAEEDIICYKLLQLSGENHAFSEYSYEGYPFRYDIGVRNPYQSIILHTTNKIHYSVHKGYHSFKSEPTHHINSIIFGNLKCYKCIIPKGSNYIPGFENTRLGYVSSEIIVVGKTI